MRFHCKALVAAVALAGAASAQAQIYTVSLSGNSEIPAITTNGSGTAIVTLNSTTHEMRVKAEFSNLTGTTTASHIHCCAVQPANAGVATTTPTFAGFPLGVTAGRFDATYDMRQASSWNAAFITANGNTPASAETALLAGVTAGSAYLNIHSTFATGGEIRGTLTLFKFTTGAAPTVASVAGALDSLGAGTGVVNERLVTMAMLEPATRTQAMTALQPLSGASLSALTANTLFLDYDQIGNRLGGLRPNDAASGLWLRYAKHGGKQELSTRNAKTDTDGWDVTAGYDFRIGGDTLLGLALGYAQDDLTYARGMAGSSGNIDGWRATAYAEQTLGNVFLDGMISLARHNSDAIRNTGMGSLANSQTNGDQWGARLAAGWNTDLGSNLSLTPQVRLDWSKLDLDAYNESGGGGLALNVASQSLDRLRASVGGQLDWAWSATIKPYVRAFWGYEFKDGEVTTSATFATGGSPFTVTDQGPGSSAYTLGLGINVLQTNTFSAAVSFDHSNNDDYKHNMLQVKAYWRF
ncbi:MAG: autotransporter domain-containing protein [Pseudomonadales bacterium]|jgi:outer membrane autotransporter protein|nr:autotransporter domain-containing protein [Pseudomonadales bacterium]